MGKATYLSLKRRTVRHNFRSRATTPGWMALRLLESRFVSAPTPDLYAAVESAKCGDTLLLAAGASFEIKDLPAKKCDDQHYITIRTDTPDSKLPPEGTRISPAWAGVASLPGRPAYAQPAGGPAKLMSTLVVKSAFRSHNRRSLSLYWCGVGLQAGRSYCPPGHNRGRRPRNFRPQLVASSRRRGNEQGDRDVPRYTIHRCHQFLSQRVPLRGAYRHLHRLLGRRRRKWGRSHQHPKDLQQLPRGVSQNILFGGAKSEVNPTDIEIRRNHLFKPMTLERRRTRYTRQMLPAIRLSSKTISS